MKILLLGHTGQLGWELNRALQPLGQVIALDYPEIDLSAPENIRRLIRECKPDLVVNTAGYTDVDRAESEPELAMAVNSSGVSTLAEEVKKLGAALIHYSSDYVFDGTKDSPYTETDEPNPMNIYGRSKLAGDLAIRDSGCIHLIFRTSWMYSLRRPCFVTNVLSWAKNHDVLRIVDDQVGNPTSARMLAEATAQVIARGGADPIGYLSEVKSLYNLAGTGCCSRFEWAQEIIQIMGMSSHITVIPAKTSEFPTPAQRPAFSPLDCSKARALGIYLPDWQSSLMLCLVEI